MSASHALAEARRAGVSVRGGLGKLILHAAAKPPQALLDQLAAHKPEILTLLARQNDYDVGISADGGMALATVAKPVAVPPKEVLIDRLTRALNIRRPWYPTEWRDEVRAALYWRIRAIADLARLDGDPGAQLRLVQVEEARAGAHDGLVTVDFVAGDDPPVVGLDPLPGNEGALRVAITRPSTWSQAVPSGIMAGAFCGACGSSDWRSDSERRRWWCGHYHPHGPHDHA